MSQMENAIDIIINVFHQYSIQKPHPDKLSKGETKNLIQKELAEFLKNQVNPLVVEEMFKQLDQDQDKELSFQEFMQLVVQVTVATHNNLHAQ
ncbi:protein MRP-126-like [Anolis carolinensis]|uniref:Protein S100 n=1 Tax=Anolis carolinensis TaxID=28377 RepID=H9GT13_ANOCA|nr:PREDICTED: protein MRP-126-like [Anolis carolinensis]|eukprot:XP_016854246.1 PREDICTED: protein MRP-126-like [Anolis carolinensis]